MGLVDETRDHDEDTISEVVIPLLNVSRFLPDGTVNPREPNRQLIFMSSASVKGDYNYDKLIDIFENSIIDPSSSFVMGLDFRVPQKHGLIAREYINKLKMSPSFSEESFAREYASIFTGGGEDSWYSYDKLQRYRKIKNPEKSAKFVKDQEIFYLLSVDISHFGDDKSIVTVFRVNITKDKFLITVSNIYQLGKTPETRAFNKQSIEIKKLINLYKAKHCVVDLNGVGGGLGDFLIQDQYEDGVCYPALGFCNDKDYLKIQPSAAPRILYGLKANATLKSQVNAATYQTLMSGRIRFLIKEQEAKAALYATQVGQKMSPLKRAERLLPHELTTRLFEEMANLKIKQAGTDIILESINSRIHDDKYYSFAYGIYRIHELEEEYYRKQRRKTGLKRQLTFFTGG